MSPSSLPSGARRPRAALALVAGFLLLAKALVAPGSLSLRGADGVAIEPAVRLLELALAGFLLLLAAADRLVPRGGAAPPLLDAPPLPPAPSARLRRIAALVVLAGLALRCVDLGAGLWFDEIDTLLRYGRQSLWRAVGTYETQNNHLAYSVLARLSIAAFGESAAALRLPAVLLGAASLWATWRLALLVAPPREALVATAVLALSAQHVWFSQDARGYTGLLCATLLATHAFLVMARASSATGLRRPLGYGLAAASGVWLHPTAALVVVAHALTWLVLCLRRPAAGANRWPPLWGFAFAASLALVGYALVLPQLVALLGRPSMEGFATEWRNPLWMLRETASGLAAGLPGGWLALAGGALVLALGVASHARASLAVLALFLLPAALTAGALLATGHNLWPRFFFFAAAFGVLLVVRGASVLAGLAARGPLAGRESLLAGAAGLALVLASAWTLPRAYGPKQDFEAAARFVDEHAPAGSVATLEMGDLPFLDWLGKPWARLRSEQDLSAFEAGREEVWVVVATPAYLQAVQPQTWRRLAQEYREERVFQGTLRGGEILVKVRRPASRDH